MRAITASIKIFPIPLKAAGARPDELVRIAYATIVFGVLAFFVIYFGAPFVYLGGPGTVSSPRYAVSLPYTVQISHMNLVSGTTVKAGEEIAEVISPEQDSIVATYMRALADIAGRTAELRIKARVAQESLESARSWAAVTIPAIANARAVAIVGGGTVVSSASIGPPGIAIAASVRAPGDTTRTPISVSLGFIDSQFEVATGRHLRRHRDRRQNRGGEQQTND